jgi:hypothetical protein
MTHRAKRIAVACLFAALAGCGANPDDRATTSNPSTSVVRAASEPAKARGRTQMWTENCIRCHNARSPGYYSDREWQVAMHHMRVRCSITKEEYESILSFLQSAN